MSKIELNTYRTDECFLQSELIVNIQVPSKAVDEFARILGEEIPLIQGYYSHCMYIRNGGRCRFKGSEGAYGGSEEAIQEVESAEIIISIPPEHELLDKIFKIINQYHVHEEPTVKISKAFGLRSLYNGDANNPNKYWNRSDHEKIHGEPVG